MDLQVLIPRTIDVAKSASVNEQQRVTAQQQLSAQLKQSTETKQRQVQTKLSSQQDGRVSTDDLDRDKQNEHHRHEGRGGKATADAGDLDPENLKLSPFQADPLRGHTIDIKT